MMRKLRNFFISFNDNENAVYCSGQMISGSVVVHLNAPMDMQAVKIKFHGKADVHWSESSGTGDDRKTDHYHASETYFTQNIFVFGKGSGGYTEGAKQLPAGESAFPFNFQLPSQLPSSFEGNHGRVRYFAKASIVKPWKFDHNTKRGFTVLETVDLNQDPNARLSVTNNDSKTLCCFCCASGPIQAQVQLDRTGYVPGEFILINASVDNRSSSDMPSTRATIVQHVILRSTTKARNETNKITSMSGPGCRGGDSIEWNHEKLQIPPLPPTMVRFCSIILITYTLEFCVVVPSGSINLRVKLPLTLGTIPLQGLTPYALPALEPTAPPLPQPLAPPLPQPLAPPLPQPLAPPFPQPLDVPPAYEPPPPSYASVAGGGVNIRDEDDNDHLMGETSYSPQYAYYDWSQSAFTYTNQ